MSRLLMIVSTGQSLSSLTVSVEQQQRQVSPCSQSSHQTKHEWPRREQLQEQSLGLQKPGSLHAGWGVQTRAVVLQPPVLH